MNRANSDMQAQLPLVPNLPTVLTSFVGRKREIAGISQLLTSSHVVSLVGTGGCGKTRIALRVATEVINQYADGVFWFEFTRVADPALVPQVVAKTLKVVESPDASLIDALLNALRDRQMLLVLDNCEHLLEACAQLVDILVSAPKLRILVTSREALGIQGEALYPVLPLAVPTLWQTFSEIVQFDAVQLFIERAQSILPGFGLTPENAELVATICRDLDGVPLAIELTSARVNVLSLHQIQTRLNQRLDFLVSMSRGDRRHHTLRATIDWSYALLSSAEQLLLRRLAVFVAGFTLNTAEAVCAWGEIPPDQILEPLTSLVNKSLVVAETMQDSEARYHLLETIRQYAHEKLSDSGERSSVQDRYLAWFVQRTDEVAPKLHEQYQQLWFNWLETENDNIRAALAWTVEQHRIESGLRIATALFQFWIVRDYIREGFTWFQRLLVQVDGHIPLAVQVNALTNAAFLALFLSDVRSVTDWGQRAVSLCEAAGEEGKPLLGFALAGLGSAAGAVGDVQTVFTMTERILELERPRGDNYKVGMALFILGKSAIVIGKYDVAHVHLDEALVFAREGGDRYRIADILNFMGDLARCEQRFGQAYSLYEESISLFRDLGARQDIANALRNLAYVCLRQGNVEQAHALFRESLEANQVLGNTEAILHSLLGFAAFAAFVGLADASVCLTVRATAQSTRRAELRGADKLDFEYFRVLIQETLSDAEFEAAQAKGHTLSVEQAIEYALKLTLPFASAAEDGRQPSHELTAREREVALLIARGLSNSEIASELVISKRTVEKHIANILSKFGFTNRAQIVRWAIQNGLI